jgi:hypothetical protein
LRRHHDRQLCADAGLYFINLGDDAALLRKKGRSTLSQNTRSSASALPSAKVEAPGAVGTREGAGVRAMCCFLRSVGSRPRDRGGRLRGKFDGLFLADVLGVYDVYQGSVDAALRHATQIPVNDPLLLVPAMAQVTRHLGFGVTCTLSGADRR